MCAGTISCGLILPLIILLFIVYIKWKHCYWSRRKVVTSKQSFFFGNSKSIFFQLESFGENLRNWCTDLKGKGLKYGGYYMFLNPIWVVLDLDLVKNIMTKDFRHFVDRCIYTNEKNDPLTGQLLLRRGKKWKTLRTKLTPIFTSGKIKDALPIFTKCSEELIKVIEEIIAENRTVEMKDIMARHSTDSICSYAFGIDCDSLRNPDAEFRRYGKMALGQDAIQAVKQFLAFTCPFIMDNLKLPLFPQKVIDYFLKTVKEVVEYRDQYNVIRNDFMHLLIQLKNNVVTKNGVDSPVHKQSDIESLTMEEVTAQAFMFFLGGYETSSTTLTFCLYELVCNPEVQQRLQKELLEIYEKYDHQITYDSLKEMSYLENCICETLRKYPPFPILLRQCTEKYKVPGTDLEIEEGTRVFIPALDIHYDPEYYPEPEVFNPDRFTPNNRLQRHPFAWLPFGEGPRICIGQRFGMMQIKVVLATLLKHYKFSLNEKTTVPPIIDPKNFLLTTKDGIWLDVEKVS